MMVKATSMTAPVKPRGSPYEIAGGPLDVVSRSEKYGLAVEVLVDEAAVDTGTGEGKPVKLAANA
jgi:hypothetical protein